MLSQKIIKVQPFLPRLITYPKKVKVFFIIKNHFTISVCFNTFVCVCLNEACATRGCFYTYENVCFHLLSLTHTVLFLLVANHSRHLCPAFGNLMKYTFCLSALSGSRHIFITPPKHDICSCDAKDVSSQNTK